MKSNLVAATTKNKPPRSIHPHYNFNNPLSPLAPVESLSFLDAPSHLYKRVCPSVGPSVRPWVRPSVGPSVNIKEKRGLGAFYVGYPTLLRYFFGKIEVDSLWGPIVVSNPTFPS